MIGFDTCCSDDNGTNVTLGKIKLTDANGDIFIDLAGALAYVQQFTTAEITETSFADGVFYFTVNANTAFDLSDYFCASGSSAKRLQFEDSLGLVTAFGNYSFVENTENNIIGNASFKENVFVGSTGNNTLGDCLFTGSQAFLNSTGNNNLGNCVFEKGFHFGGSSGNNTLGDCQFDTVTIEGGNFSSATGNNNLGNCVFNGGADFDTTTGNNSFGFCEFYGQSFYSATSNNFFKKFYGEGLNYHFRFATGNNVFLDATIAEGFFMESSTGNNTIHSGGGGAEFFNSSEGNNIFGKNITFAVASFNNSVGDNFFGESCVFEQGAFNNSSGNNSFQDKCLFLNTSFSGATGNNNFGSECVFFDYSFNASSGNNNFNNKCVFGIENFSHSTGNNSFGTQTLFADTCFKNSESNNEILSATFGNQCFINAAPKIKNSVGEIINVGSEFALNYLGRFDITQTLGLTAGTDLPIDIFTTANICSIHIPNALQYNNGGSPDGDLVNLLANVTNPNSLITYD